MRGHALLQEWLASRLTAEQLAVAEPAGEEKTDGEGFTSSGLLSKELLAGFVAAKSEFGT